jgi:hypothetical protein
MVTQSINDPQYWRQRADESRRVAEMLADEPSRETVREIARSYDRIAEITEKRSIDGTGTTPKPGM